MFFSIPLLIVALGGMFSERSGVVNIALEGIMIMGAFSSILIINIVQSSGAALPPQLLLLLAVLIAAAVGVLVSMAHAYASINMKADQVISENGYPIQTEHGNLDSLNGFSGDLVITMDDLADELKDKVPYALGIRNIMDKVEMKSKMEEFLATK